jgi:hypothetical protein
MLRQAERERRPKKRPKPQPYQPRKPREQDERPIPGRILLTLGRYPHPWECDRFAIWNVLGLGHWSGFDERVLMQEIWDRRFAA